MSTKDHNERLEVIEKTLLNELDTIKREIDDLYETVYKGNGKPSLVTRVSGVESKLRGLREQMDEKIAHLSRENSLKFDSLHQKIESKFGRLEGWIDTKFTGVENLMKSMAEVDKVSRSGQWQLKAAAITGVMALVGTLIAYFVN
jgi:fructose-1,6-bisphosphatase